MRYGSQLPGITTFKSPKRMALDDVQLSATVFGDSIEILTGEADSGHTGQTNVLRPGNVVAKKSGSSKFILASNANWADIDKGAVAAINSAEAPDGDWVSKVVKLYRNGVKVAEVTLAGDDDSTSEVRDALNADPEFAANALATGEDAAVLVITDLHGKGDALTVEINLDTAYAVDIGTSSIAHAKGSLPDVRVLGEEVCMVDAAGNAIDGFSSFNFWSGHFKATDLIVGGTQATQASDIPAWARAVLEARGSKIVA